MAAWGNYLRVYNSCGFPPWEVLISKPKFEKLLGQHGDDLGRTS
jgi:hypothetical protein